jgi:hypothetical protein
MGASATSGRLTPLSGGAKNVAMQGISRGLRHLAIIALLVRAMLPAGWMPDAHAGLVICSAGTLGTIHHDGDQKAPAQIVHEECAFAAAPHLAATPDSPQIVLPAFHAFAARTDAGRAAVIAAHFTPGSPRAPPLNV